MVCLLYFLSNSIVLLATKPDSVRFVGKSMIPAYKFPRIVVFLLFQKLAKMIVQKNFLRLLNFWLLLHLILNAPALLKIHRNLQQNQAIHNQHILSLQTIFTRPLYLLLYAIYLYIHIYNLHSKDNVL